MNMIKQTNNDDDHVQNKINGHGETVLSKLK